MLLKFGVGELERYSDAVEPHEAGLLKLSIERAQKELNWQPKLNAQQAIEWTIDWYKQPAEKLCCIIHFSRSKIILNYKFLALLHLWRRVGIGYDIY